MARRSTTQKVVRTTADAPTARVIGYTQPKGASQLESDMRLPFIVICAALSGCTTLEYMIARCHASEGHPVIIIDTEWQPEGVRCEVPI